MSNMQGDNFFGNEQQGSQGGLSRMRGMKRIQNMLVEDEEGKFEYIPPTNVLKGECNMCGRPLRFKDEEEMAQEWLCSGCTVKVETARKEREVEEEQMLQKYLKKNEPEIPQPRIEMIPKKNTSAKVTQLPVIQNQVVTFKVELDYEKAEVVYHGCGNGFFRFYQQDDEIFVICAECGEVVDMS